MDSSSSEPDGPGRPLPSVSLWRTLRVGLRAAWDRLGLVCAGSLLLFAAAGISLSIAAVAPSFGRPFLARGAAAVLAFSLILSPIYFGLCRIAGLAFAHDEVSFGTIWSADPLWYGRAAACGFLDLLGLVVLGANLAFYLRAGGVMGYGAAAFAVYMALFWLMNCLYHMPLLAACKMGLIGRPGGGRAGFWSIYRNGFLMAISSAAYSLALILILAALMALLAASGIGAAMLGGGLAAFTTSRAVRDQLVRFGVIPADADQDAPVGDEVWRMRG